MKLTFSVEHSLPDKNKKNLTREIVMKEYNDLCSSIGTIDGQCSLHLKENAIPTINPPRRIPDALRARVKSELDRMIKDKIITKVSEPPDCVNSLVVGALRICLDPKALNEAIR
jgi:hypothetical protein